VLGFDARALADLLERDRAWTRASWSAARALAEAAAASACDQRGKNIIISISAVPPSS
jgi:hypothetical protein